MKYLGKKYKIFLFSLFPIFLISQDSINSTFIPSKDSLQNKAPFNFEEINPEVILQGHIYDPKQLLRNSFGGLLSYKDGDNPNSELQLRYRGLKTLRGNNQPLIILNGVKYAHTKMLEPFDIFSIQIINSSHEITQSGIGANQGVLNIQTACNDFGKKTLISTGITLSSKSRSWPILNTSEYINAKDQSLNEGDQTNWWNNISRTAISNYTYLSHSNNWEKINFKISASHRNVQGVGVSSGYDQYYTSATISQSLLKGKINWIANGIFSSRNSRHSFNDVFKYATIYNPTAPINDASVNNPAGPTGNYYQRQIFDYFNPVAINEQGIDKSKQTYKQASLQLNYEDIIDGLDFTTIVSFLNSDILEGEYFPVESYYRSSSNQDYFFGLSNSVQSKSIQNFLKYNIDLGKISSTPSFNYEFTLSNREKIVEQALIAPVQNFDLDLVQNVLLGIQNFNNWDKEDHSLSGLRFGLELDFDKKVELFAQFSREGSSRFAAGHKWANYVGVDLKTSLSKWMKNDQVHFNLKTGYGTAGNDAFAPHLYLKAYRETEPYYFPGINDVFVTRNANSALRREISKEFYLNLFFNKIGSPLSLYINFYRNTSHDLIFPVQVSSPPNSSNITFANLDDIQFVNSGIDFGIRYEKKYDRIKWTSQMIFSIYKSRVNDSSKFNSAGQFTLLNQDGEYMPDLSSQFIVFASGESPGQIFGLKYSNFSNGMSVYEDVDRSGFSTRRRRHGVFR